MTAGEAVLLSLSLSLFLSLDPLCYKPLFACQLCPGKAVQPLDVQGFVPEAQRVMYRNEREELISTQRTGYYSTPFPHTTTPSPPARTASGTLQLSFCQVGLLQP